MQRIIFSPYFPLIQERITFSSSGARLAIIQFGREVQTDLTFRESLFGSYDSLMTKIEVIPKLLGDETNTAKALAEAKTYFDANRR